MIQVPCWCPFTKDRLAATIHLLRPDLVPTISTTQSPFPQATSDIESNIPAPRNIPPITHGVTWNEQQDLTGWWDFLPSVNLSRWITEKMDGVRAYWDRETLVSRHGKPLQLESSFTVGLPDVPLDGELWMGRDTYHKLISLLNRTNTHYDEMWSHVGYYLFDLPSSDGVYKKRVEDLLSLQLPPHVHVVPTQECTSSQHLQQLLTKTTKEKGEGLVLRHPESLYTPGITLEMVKVKVLEIRSS